MISRLNFTESRWIFFLLTVGIFLSDDRAFTFDLTSMLDVTHCPSSLICIFTSAAVSALTESPSMLVNPVEKDTSNSLSWLLLNGMFSSNNIRASSTASICISLHLCLKQVSMEWCIFTNIFFQPLVDVRKVTEGEHPAFVVRKTVSHSSSAMSTFWLGCLH